MSWKATIIFDQDGTETAEVSGARISVNTMWEAAPDARGRRPCLIKVFNDAGELIGARHIFACYSVTKVRSDTART